LTISQINDNKINISLIEMKPDQQPAKDLKMNILMLLLLDICITAIVVVIAAVGYIMYRLSTMDKPRMTDSSKIKPLPTMAEHRRQWRQTKIDMIKQAYRRAGLIEDKGLRIAVKEQIQRDLEEIEGTDPEDHYLPQAKIIHGMVEKIIREQEEALQQAEEEERQAEEERREEEAAESEDAEESVPIHTCLCCGASFPESESVCPSCNTQYGDDGD
jgi:hypothetical protein